MHVEWNTNQVVLRLSIFQCEQVDESAVFVRRCVVRALLRHCEIGLIGGF